VPRRRDSSEQTLALLDAFTRDPDRWRHGYDLAKETGLASGTLYPILMRLEQRGVLESRWEPPERPGRPPRHAYRLTGEPEALGVPARVAPKPPAGLATAEPS
jgi:PadR family transcriptional regulator, regulatory protein PadR